MRARFFGKFFQRGAGARKQHPTGDFRVLLLRPSVGVALLLCVASWLAWDAERTAELSLLKVHQSVSVQLGGNRMRTELAAASGDALAMAGLASTRLVADRDSASARQQLAEDFLAFARQRAAYEQIRFLDTDGMERARVNLGPEGPYAVRDAYLENEASHYYFRPALARAPGDVYVSNIELDVQKGVVQFPIKFTIHFATPVAGFDGRKRGLIVIDLLAESMLADLGRNPDPQGGQRGIVDEGGDYVVPPHLEWGRAAQLQGREHASFARTLPGLWETVSSEERGYVVVGASAFAFETVHASTMGGDRGPRWKVMSEAALEPPTTRRRRLAHAALTLGLILLVAGADFVVWRAQRSRRAAERRARDQLRTFQVITDDVPAPLFYRDTEGRFLGCNAELARLLGRTPDSINGRLREEVMAPADADRARRFDELVISRNEGHRYEAEVVDTFGQSRQFLISRSPVRDEAGRATGVTGVMVDISDLKRAQAEAQRAREAAEAAGRAKAEFLAVMSHEIRTPLNAVIGMMGLLLETALDAEQRDFAETTRSSGEALLTVINDILDFSKIEAGKLELEEVEFEPRALLDDTLGLVAEGAHAKGLELVGLVEAAVPQALRGDPGRLRQILLNLLSNAVKFTEKGEITAGLRLDHHADGRVRLRLEVADTGIGMAPSAQERVFDAFTQADASTTRRYGGTGLGLAITRRLVEMMGGTIVVATQLGQGSRFSCTVELEAGAGTEATPQARELRGRRVLIVDDSQASRGALAEMLRAWDMHVEEAAGPGRAAARLEPGEPLPDLLFLDAHPAEDEGVAFLKVLKGQPHLAEIPVVVMVGFGASSSAHEARVAGAAAVITKPIRQSQLLDCLLTLVSPDLAAERRGLAPARGPLFGGRRILVVEDNAVNQRVSAAQLGRLGCQVDLAGNGLEALAALERKTYDLVLMDCQMPEMDGFVATRTIRDRETGQRLPIVAMTANALRGDREACLAAGMDDYVTKPARPEDLARILERFTGGGSSRSDLPRLPGSAGASSVLRPRVAGGDASPSPAVLDSSVLQSLRDLEAAAEPGLLREILETFRDTAADKIEAMRRAAQAGDHETLERAAHSLKGSCGMVGAQRMAERCRSVEAEAERGACGPQPGLDAVGEEWAYVREEIEALLRTEAAPEPVEGAA